MQTRIKLAALVAVVFAAACSSGPSYSDTVTPESFKNIVANSDLYQDDDSDVFKRAISRLGTKSIGMTLGDIVHNERHFENQKAAASQPPAMLQLGTVATVTQKGDGSPCWDDHDAIDAAYKAANANDTEGMQQLEDQRAIMLRAGERVRVIDRHGLLPPDPQLRILTGVDSGKSCWIIGSTIQGLFKK